MKLKNELFYENMLRNMFMHELEDCIKHMKGTVMRINI